MRIFCCLLLALLTTLRLVAHEIKGKVLASDYTPLSGVGVYNETTKEYTYSSERGYFELQGISLNDVLYFYSMGYRTLQYEVGEAQLDATVDIILEETAVSLDQVVLTSRRDALSALVAVDLERQPVKSSQEVLRTVPGLMIGQHAGGGKAEQLFLRGFDIDHGTDLSLQVDGLPVNMVSHAHGQGYSDLHFLIPETIASIDFGKGPYYADQGNFATAGYVRLQTKKALEKNRITLEAGAFRTLRLLHLQKLVEGKQHNAYMASELLLTDGVFESPQNFNRLNIMGRYTYNNRDNEQLSLALSHFQSKWDASGQIPQRAIKQGLISRFGAIDDTEGGFTSRSNLWLDHHKSLDGHNYLKSTAFYSQYDFELFSNFTFFLNDTINGDQISQRESRVLFGAQTTYHRESHIAGKEDHLKLATGLGFRYDNADGVALSRTRDRRELLERLAFGNVDELNGFAFAEAHYTSGKWTLNPGLRMDYFHFNYQDLLQPTYTSRNAKKAFLAPKFNLIYEASPYMQWFAKSGIGFHSNDTRVVVANNGRDILPAAYGTDLGGVFKPTTNLAINAALWGLWLDQEFVYVGDAGIVEPSGKTRRLGVDFGLRYEPTKWLYLSGDLNFTYARSTGAPEGQDYIPLAPDVTSEGGIMIRDLGNFSGGIHYRCIKNRPATEDFSLTARGYFVTDANLSYQLQNWSLGIVVENLFDTEWNETQFATESRLKNEANPVEEIHFTPGSPFFVRGHLTVTF